MQHLRASILVLVLAFGLGLGTQAQFNTKANIFGGFSYHLVNATPQGSPAPLRYYFYGLSLGMDYVLLHSNDVASLGINPNGHFSFQFTNLYGASILAQAPVFVLGRLGAGATPFNEQKIGIGAGLGLNYSYMLHRSAVQTTSGSIYEIRFDQGFINPSAVVELAINARMSNYLFRFHWSLTGPTQEVKLGTQDYPFRFTTGGLGILYSF